MNQTMDVGTGATNGATPSSAAVAGPTFEEVERRGDLTPESFLRDYARPNRPVVVTGQPFWSGGALPTLSSLRSLVGHKRLDEITGLAGGVGSAPALKKKMVTLGDFLTWLEEVEAELEGKADRSLGTFARQTQEGVPYLTNMGLPGNFPELVERFTPAACFGPNVLRRFDLTRDFAAGEIFVGPRATTFGQMHFDSHCVFVMTYQLFGRKKWNLFAPSESAHLYPTAQPDDWYPHQSQVNAENPDLEQFPLFAKAKGFSTVLEPGDVLFCPSSWWHDTRNLTASISIAVRHVNRANARNVAIEHYLLGFILRATRRYKRWIFERYPG
ncbi:MAG TPA: cupin-like domain-containing protein [Polyangiaceae bacterium]|jgi:hypothetical protein